MSILILLACTHDFGLEAMPPVAEAPLEDTGWVDSGFGDTGEPVTEDTGETPVTEDPDEEEPVEEYPDDPAPEDDCENTSDLIYLVSRSDEGIYLFDPSDLSFERLGTLDCDWISTPNSMAVGRDGAGYVRYSDNSVYQVDLETMECSNTSYGAGSFGAFGMGFATNTSDTWRDKLYVANKKTLAVLDTSTWSLAPVGTLPSQSELTGNADGELWAFLPLESPAALVQLNKANGSVTDRVNLPGFPAPTNIDAFAFAAWDGAFYLFVREYGMGESTDVYEVDSTGTMRKVLNDVGFDVVGAGVSTCAPA
jgi:hypothetical protein